MRRVVLLVLAACVHGADGGEDDTEGSETDGVADTDVVDEPADTGAAWSTRPAGPLSAPLACPPGTLRFEQTPEDALWSAWGEEEDGELGAALAAGDVDGDGQADLVVGEPLDSAASFRRGAVHLLRGPLPRVAESVIGRDDTVDGRVFEGRSEILYDWGRQLVLADLDGDGAVEAVATFGIDEVTGEYGERRIFAGVLRARDFTGAPPDPRVEIEPSGQGPDAVLRAWTNGAGRTRVGVGAPFDVGEDDLERQVGRVRVLGPDLRPLAVVVGTSWEQAIGAALASVGDLDRDGEPELAIGAWDGSVRVLSGASIEAGAPEVLLTVAGEEDDGPLPLGVGVPVLVGDQDGDGVPDLLVQRWSDGGGSLDPVTVPPEHHAWLYAGLPGPGSMLTRVDARARLPRLRPVELVHDLDGDGVPDLVVLADEGLRVVAGPLASTTPRVSGLLVRSGDAPGPVAIADLTGDGRPELAVGFPRGWRSHDPVGSPGVVRVWELCPTGR